MQRHFTYISDIDIHDLEKQLQYVNNSQFADALQISHTTQPHPRTPYERYDRYLSFYSVNAGLVNLIRIHRQSSNSIRLEPTNATTSLWVINTFLFGLLNKFGGKCIDRENGTFIPRLNTYRDQVKFEHRNDPSNIKNQIIEMKIRSVRTYLAVGITE